MDEAIGLGLAKRTGIPKKDMKNTSAFAEQAAYGFKKGYIMPPKYTDIIKSTWGKDIQDWIEKSCLPLGWSSIRHQVNGYHALTDKGIQSIRSIIQEICIPNARKLKGYERELNEMNKKQ